MTNQNQGDWLFGQYIPLGVAHTCETQVIYCEEWKCANCDKTWGLINCLEDDGDRSIIQGWLWGQFDGENSPRQSHSKCTDTQWWCLQQTWTKWEYCCTLIRITLCDTIINQGLLFISNIDHKVCEKAVHMAWDRECEWLRHNNIPETEQCAFLF